MKLGPRRLAAASVAQGAASLVHTVQGVGGGPVGQPDEPASLPEMVTQESERCWRWLSAVGHDHSCVIFVLN